MAGKKVLTEDEAQEMLEAMRVVFLSDISVKLSNLVDGLDEFEKRPRAARPENGQRSGESP